MHLICTIQHILKFFLILKPQQCLSVAYKMTLLLRCACHSLALKIGQLLLNKLHRTSCSVPSQCAQSSFTAAAAPCWNAAGVVQAVAGSKTKHETHPSSSCHAAMEVRSTSVGRSKVITRASSCDHSFKQTWYKTHTLLQTNTWLNTETTTQPSKEP